MKTIVNPPFLPTSKLLKNQSEFMPCEKGSENKGISPHYTTKLSVCGRNQESPPVYIYIYISLQLYIYIKCFRPIPLAPYILFPDIRKNISLS